LSGQTVINKDHTDFKIKSLYKKKT